MKRVAAESVYHMRAVWQCILQHSSNKSVDDDVMDSPMNFTINDQSNKRSQKKMEDGIQDLSSATKKSSQLNSFSHHACNREEAWNG